MLTTHYDQCQIGNTVPYGRAFKGVQRNHGFVDLRARPDLAAGIPEASESDALKALLVAAANSASPIFTLGCDLGSHEESDDQDNRYVAGGYVQLMNRSYAESSSEDYLALTHTIASVTEANSDEHLWELRFECTPVDFRLDVHSGIIPSLWVWFFASGRTKTEALVSREILISVLSAAIGSSILRRNPDRSAP